MHCATCRYFVLASNSPDVGACRRYPPTNGQPFVKPDWWCGEHQAKATNAVAPEKTPKLAAAVNQPATAPAEAVDSTSLL